jgi:uncharacterized damage-inducible protein DinB
MDRDTLIQFLEFSRQRLLAILDAIEKSGQDVQKVLAWRPAPGRAHIGWQAMHLAATHDRYLNVRIKGGAMHDEQLGRDYAGGSAPSDANVPSLSAIRDKLAANYRNLKEHAATAELTKRHTMPNGKEQTLEEALLLLAWHEAHHQGQIHLTWNMYKAAHGVA